MANAGEEAEGDEGQEPDDADDGDGGDNEDEFSPITNSPNILQDGCRNKRKESKTIFEVRTKKLGQLPLVDFYPVDYGKPHQAFGFEVGPVCFR